MKGDFTRNTFDPLKNFSRVLMQQGRVQLDADFNEQASILLHYLRTMMADLIGPYAGPTDHSGFKIEKAANGDLKIGTGRYYVDGVLCENDREDLTYLGQEGLSNEDTLDSNKTYYAYLDVWERHITHLQDDHIREKALGGPDTCSRAKIVWQVKVSNVENISTNNQIGCDEMKKWIKELPPVSNALLKARVHPIQGEPNECTVLPEARYRGAENHLYRIEIHLGGPAGTATFNWSRDNGSVVFPVMQQKGNSVTLQSLGRDEPSSLRVGDVVEIIDDDNELREKPGVMAEVEKVDRCTMTVYLKQLDGNNWPDYDENSTKHPLLRRWDQRPAKGSKMNGGAIVISESNDPNSGWIKIEDGIEVQFQPPDTGEPARQYRTGDYWLIPARVTTGKIEWPTSAASDGKEIPKAQRPHGIEHHYAPLAVIYDTGNPTDCRCEFKPAAICPDS